MASKLKKGQLTRHSTQQSFKHSSSICSQSERRELDSEYIQLREVICNTQFYRTTSRHIRIRFNLWSKKLDQIVSDVPWKRNRNNYIKLLYLMAQAEIIVEPFLSLPPQGDLPFLRNYEINAIVNHVESKVNEKIGKYGFCENCLIQEKQRSLPFRLQTSRPTINLQPEDEGSIEKLTFYDHSSFQPKKINNKTCFVPNYQTKTTLEITSQWESHTNQTQADTNQKENDIKFNNTVQNIDGKRRQSLRQPLKPTDGNTVMETFAPVIGKLHEQSDDIDEQMKDLEESVVVPAVKMFHYFNWKHSKA